jgi:citrate synthase
LTLDIVKIDYAINMSTDMYVTANEASDWLGVSRATLYAYVSRGMIRSEAIPGSKTRRYHREDVEALARRGRGAGPRASATAMRFGEPILESSISLIRDGRLYYRGREATGLAQTRSFEEVAALLWTGEAGSRAWSAAVGLDADHVRGLVRAAGDGPAIERAMAGLGAVGLRDPGRFAALGEQAAGAAGRIVRAIVALMAPEARVGAVLAAGSTAEALWIALSDGGAPADPVALGALDGALVLCADHELNASTFAARVAASTGANLYAVVVAALATLSGPRHGGASDRVEAMLAEVAREAGGGRDVEAAVAARLARGAGLVEYGHPLYPDGDPRFVALRRSCDEVQFDAAAAAALGLVDAVNDAARRLGYGAPTLDVGLVSLRMALGLPAGSAAAIFAAGRTAGWIAHALEQAATGELLRPRARYVGPPPPQALR